MIRTLLAILLLCGSTLGQHAMYGPITKFASSSSAPPPGLNLVLHVVASQNVTNTSGTSPPSNNDRIKGWGDISGNGYHLQDLAGGTSDPLFISSGGAVPNPNSQPFIYFDADLTAQCMTNKNVPNQPQTNTFIFVMYEPGHTQNACLLNEAAGQNTQLNRALTGVWGWHMYAAGNDVNDGLPWSTAAWHVITLSYSGINSIIRVDGTQTSGPNNPGSGGCKGITIANFFNQTGGLNIAIAEVLWYNGTAYPTTSLHTLEQSLGTTYGITIN